MVGPRWRLCRTPGTSAYLAAQLVVVPAVLIWLHRSSPALYRGLRNTVIATWLLALPVFAAFPVAPPRLAGIGVADVVSHGRVRAHRALHPLLA